MNTAAQQSAPKKPRAQFCTKRVSSGIEFYSVHDGVRVRHGSEDEARGVVNDINAKLDLAEGTPHSIIHGNWGHIFHDNGSEVNVRFAFDVGAEHIVAMQIQRDHKWVLASRAEIADVEDSLKTANEDALADPEGWELEVSNKLPDWAL